MEWIGFIYVSWTPTKNCEDEMNKELALRIIKLLSALEAAGLMADKRLPDYLYEDIGNIVDELSKEILKS